MKLLALYHLFPPLRCDMVPAETRYEGEGHVEDPPSVWHLLAIHVVELLYTVVMTVVAMAALIIGDQDALYIALGALSGFVSSHRVKLKR